MTVMVAIPYGGLAHPESLQKCVESVLAQSYDDIVCVVLGDGVEPPKLERDPRLVVHTMKENHGTYFARQVLLEASPYEWHAPVDSDDWIDPTHLEVMFAQLDGTQAAVPRQVRGWVEGRGPRVYGAGRYHVGLIGTERMRAFGGYGPHERLGQDTLMLRLLALTGEVRSVSAPVTYNRVRRPGSLTMDVKTSHSSNAREQVKSRNRLIFRRAHELRAPDAIRAYRETVVPADVAKALKSEVARLSRKLGGRIKSGGSYVVGDGAPEEFVPFQVVA